MKKTLPILLFLIFTGILAGQLKISQYPNTNALGPNQLFIVTAGATNMNVKKSDMLKAIGATEITNNNLWLNGTLTIPPGQDLVVQDRLLLSADFVDANNSSGTPGQVLTSTGAGTGWSNAPSSTGGGIVTGTAGYVGGTTNFILDCTTTNVFRLPITQNSGIVLTNGTDGAQITLDFEQSGGTLFTAVFVPSVGGALTNNVRFGQEITGLYMTSNSVSFCKLYYRAASTLLGNSNWFVWGNLSKY